MVIKFIKNLLFVTIPTIVIVLALCEIIVFRVIIPASDPPKIYFDNVYNILRYDSSQHTKGLYSVGPLSQQKSHYRINNMGWNSAIDYNAHLSKPLIAIIGDSFIAALNVDPEKSIAARLRHKLNGKYEVYSFGIGGAPLSQYLQISRYVNNVFNPDLIVINVMHNDFVESLASVGYRKGMLFIDDSGSEPQELPIEPYAYNKLQTRYSFLMKSSVFRYLTFNIGVVGHYYERLKYFINRDPNKYNANVDIEQVNRNKSRMIKVVDYIVHKLKLENKNRKIIIMFDAARRDIYNNNINNSNVIWMNNLLGEVCKYYNVPFIDLNNHFCKTYNLTHVKFETPYDNHWNEHGHETAAEALFYKINEIDGR